MRISLQENMHFHNASLGTISLHEVITAIQKFLEEDPHATYRLLIGTDSHERTYTASGPKQIAAVTAVVIYRIGSGGRYFWQKRTIDGIFTLRDKIYAETLISLEFAHVFVPMVHSRLNGDYPEYDLEIHVDVGERGASREVIKEVVGIVTGHGFIAKTKPESFAASHVADRYT